LLRYFDEEQVFYALGIEDEETKEEIKKTLYADYTGIPGGGGRVEVSRFD
jgi:hypothetical protein